MAGGFGEERLGKAVAELSTDQRPFDAGLAQGKRKAQSWVADVSRTLQGAGRAIGNAGQKLTLGVTLPIIAAGTAIFKVGSDFEHTMSKIVGLVGISRDQIEAWKPEIEELAKSTGIGPVKLAEALYFVASSGIEASKAMGVLTIAARASMAGMGDVVVLADGLTSAMAAYAKSGLTAADATDILVRAIQVGKAEPAEFADAMGMLAPMGAQLKVTFADLMGTLAAMSRVNSNNAENVTSLVQVFSTLLAPTNKTKEALEAVGLTAEGLRKVLMEHGTVAALRVLAAAVGDDDQAIAEVFPNIRALRGVLNLMSQDAGGTADALAQVADHAGALDGAVSAVSDDVEVKLNRALARVQVALIHLGVTLLPRVAGALEHLAGVVDDLVAQWDRLDDETRNNVVTAVLLLAVLGPILKVVGWLVGGVGLLVKVVGLLGPVVTFLAGALGTTTAIAAGLVAVFVVLGALIVGLITNFNGMGDAFVNGIRIASVAITGFLQLILQVIHNVAAAAAAIPTPFQGAFQAIADATAAADAEIEKFRRSVSEAAFAAPAAARGVRDAASSWDTYSEAAMSARAASQYATQGIGDDLSGLPDDVAGVVPDVQAILDELAATMPDALTGAGAKAKEIVHQTLADLAASLVAGQTDWQAAWKGYRDVMENDLTKAQEIALIKGKLSGKALARGLRSTDPERKAAAEAMKAQLEERLWALRNNVPQIARAAGVSYADALAATKREVGTAGGKLTKALQQKIIIDLAGPGTEVTKTWAAGIASGAALAAVRAAGAKVAGTLRSYLHASSPPKEGPLHTIDEGGAGVTETWGRALLDPLRTLPRDLGISLRPIAAALNGLALAPASPTLQPALAAAGGAPSAGLTITGGIHLHGVGSDVSPAAAHRFGRQVIDEVASGFREQLARRQS